MSIQKIAITNNQKKKVLKALDDERIVFKDDNGDIVINREAYQQFKQDNSSAPIEAIVTGIELDFKYLYFVLS